MSTYFPRGTYDSLPDFAEGVCIPVDKPEGWTSFDVVAKLRNTLRRYLGVKKFKVGHSGTLDPFATGLLLICTGKATKELGEMTLADKVYTGKMRFGGWTATYDLTSEVLDPVDVIDLDPDELRESVRAFTGWIDQQVPPFSAVKLGGQRLYEKARKGVEVQAPVRKVQVHSFDITYVHGREAAFRVHCGKGTYIRSLAHDLGKVIGCGAFLSELRREAIGDHSVTDAWPLDELLHMLLPDPGQSST